MYYKDIIAKLEENKMNLTKKLGAKNLLTEEYETLKNEIENYNYIIELTEMNHYERGFID